MVKLSEELRNNIINDIKNNIDIKEIIKIRNVSKSTIYRISCEIKKNNTTIIAKPIQENSLSSDSKSNSSLTKDFDLEIFKKELNNNEVNIGNNKVNVENNNKVNIENNNKVNVGNNNIENESSDKESSEEESYEEEESNEEYNEDKLIKPIPVSLNQSNNSISFRKNNNQNNNINQNNNKVNLNVIDKNNIIDTIKNCNNAENIDELIEIRSIIIRIRQYINTFPNDLKNIWSPNKLQFEKKLFNLKLNELEVLLENIRVELNLNRNKEMFETIIHSSLIGLEKISSYCNYNVEGLTNDLMKDESFLYDLKIIQCEVDVSRWINPRSSAFLKVIKKMYMKNQENEIKNQINKVINNEDVINKIKNIK